MPIREMLREVVLPVRLPAQRALHGYIGAWSLFSIFSSLLCPESVRMWAGRVNASALDGHRARHDSAEPTWIRARHLDFSAIILHSQSRLKYMYTDVLLSVNILHVELATYSARLFIGLECDAGTDRRRGPRQTRRKRCRSGHGVRAGPERVVKDRNMTLQVLVLPDDLPNS